MRRKRWLRWVGGAAVLALLFALWFRDTGPALTWWNSQRVRTGMTQEEVEAILGPPNPLPDLRRKNEAFWDANAALGCRYVAVHVEYGADGRVARTRVSGFWRRPW